MPERTNIPSDVERYINTYLELKLIQDPSGVDADPQMNSITTLIAERLQHFEQGSIIDIGCGSGTLFSILLHLPQFIHSERWTYVAIDQDDQLDEIHKIARKALLNRRVELINLDSFYTKWPEIAKPQIIFCRNVFHELNIAKTAALLRHVAENCGPDDIFIVQDLLALPESERHNACWTLEQFEECIKAYEYSQAVIVQHGTSRGNRWFDLVAYGPTNKLPPPDEVHAIVSKARQSQWSLWSKVESHTADQLPGRSQLVEALDLDLQLAALTRQLRDDGVLEVNLEQSIGRRIKINEFTRKVAAFVQADRLDIQKIDEIVHFRERGEQLDVLENFLRSQSRIAVIYGGSWTGKTTILRHILHNRAYDKSIIFVNGKSVNNIWAFLENCLSQVGLNINVGALSVVDNLTFESIEPTVRQFINAYAHRLIIAYDNFDELTNSNGELIDKDLERALCLIGSKQGAKLVFTSRTDYVPAPLQAVGVAMIPTTVRVGRYGTDQTVVNVLDDRFNRARAGLDQYPDRLLEAIDRHPLVATLAAQALERFGTSVLMDEQFITELRLRLRSELWNRLVDEQSRPAVTAAMPLRIAVPLSMFEKLAPAESLHRARTSDLLYAVSDARWQHLIALLGLFRLREVEGVLPERVTKSESDTTDHAALADLYWEVYRIDDDPKWIRESHYHRMLSGDLIAGDLAKYAGRYYVPELIASADYCFVNKHDYKAALVLYNAASPITNLNETSLMRQASCWIRTGERQRGEKAYAVLTAAYPRNIGIRTSHIDALIFIQDYRGALSQIEGYELTEGTSNWVAQQLGRAHLGLDHYREAIGIFSRLVEEDGADPYVYAYLGRALHQYGARTEAISILRAGSSRFSNNIALKTALGVDLERSGFDEEAFDLLSPIFESYHDNSRAALGLIRIQLRRGGIDEARRILRISERHSPPGANQLVLVGRCEIMIADGHPETAADILRTEFGKDETYLVTFLDATYQWASSVGDTKLQRNIAADAARIPIPDKWTNNVPIQVRMARVASLAGDKAVFDAMIDRLSSTRIQREEIASLQEHWDARNRTEDD